MEHSMGWILQSIISRQRGNWRLRGLGVRWTVYGIFLEHFLVRRCSQFSIPEVVICPIPCAAPSGVLVPCPLSKLSLTTRLLMGFGKMVLLRTRFFFGLGSGAGQQLIIDIDEIQFRHFRLTFFILLYIKPPK